MILRYFDFMPLIMQGEHARGLMVDISCLYSNLSFSQLGISGGHGLLSSKKSLII